MLNLIFSECQLFLPINQILHLDLCSFFFFYTKYYDEEYAGSDL